MAFKGNKHAVGNKGGGRKSAYQELADATEAYRIFFQAHSQDEIEDKIRTGTFSLADRFLLTGMEGDERILSKAYQKAVPDNVDVTSGGKPLTIAFDPTFDAATRQAKGDSKE